MIKLKLLLYEETLYHGTTIDAAKNIKKQGLIPVRGDFVSTAYGGEYDSDSDFEDNVPELVFAADKKNLSKAVSAATHHVGKKLNKDFHSVTDEDFIRYAAIIKINDGESSFSRRPEGDENYYGTHPTSVEPGDYYSENYVGVDEILTGKVMIKVLKRYGLWPRDYGDTKSQETINQKKDFLIKYHLKSPKLPKQDIISKVMSLTDKEVNRWYEKYRRGY